MSPWFPVIGDRSWVVTQSLVVSHCCRSPTLAKLVVIVPALRAGVGRPPRTWHPTDGRSCEARLRRRCGCPDVKGHRHACGLRGRLGAIPQFHRCRDHLGTPRHIVARRNRRRLAAGRVLVARIGPWPHARPPLPAGLLRISVLTPSGLHFGQGPSDAFLKDPIAAPALNAAGLLMRALIVKRDERRGK